MLNPTVVLKKPPMGPPSSGLLTRFCPPLRFPLVISSPIVLKRATHRSIITTPTSRQIKELTESLLSDDIEEVDEDSSDDEEEEEDVSPDLVRKFMKYINLIVETSGSVGLEKSRNYTIKGDDAFYIRAEMPGLSKEDVKITVDKNFLVIKGEEKKEAGVEKKRITYDGKVKLETELYKVDEIKAEMKNGVLKVVVPKLMEEERKDIIQVKID
ncbi:hypothetical protein AQUCO_01100236v1 [Aquilegia coerulea]|uniref:SHSP domain-containing protein n=1 Tax=Aquilegia coerulea TaxID=218851 RepID=A0A2G5E6C4_AQUCA|nr:hypothetical protein AQUCO_01100236v1 [Aquilegia coerulea]